jgi:hypothetical protein
VLEDVKMTDAADCFVFSGPADAIKVENAIAPAAVMEALGTDDTIMDICLG